MSKFRAIKEVFDGFTDYRQKHLRDSWGGPLNGQIERQKIVKEFLRDFCPALIIETGTFRGTTTKYLADITRAPIYTVESNLRNFGFAVRQLLWKRNVRCKFGDSRHWIKKIQKKISSDSPVFAYLDAHWNEDLPLNEEIELIQRHWSSGAILIDDFEVPDDPGYGFDRYGETVALCLSYILPVVTADSAFFFPAVRSDEESGHRRGCVLVAFGGAVQVATRCKNLKRHIFRP